MCGTLPHVGDVGTAFVMQLVDQACQPIDVSGASVRRLYFTKPDDAQTVLTKTAVNDTDGVNGKIRYNLIAGDLDMPGLWKIEPFAVVGSNQFTGLAATFEVLPSKQQS